MADSERKANKRSKTKSHSRRSSSRYEDGQDEDEAYTKTKAYSKTMKVKRKKSKASKVGIPESPTKRADSPKRRPKGSGSTTDGSESPSLPKELNYEYFEMLDGNLRRAGELLEEHGRGIVWQAADIIACIPEYCPPRRCTPKLCRCNTCCERCCIDEEHRLRGFHSNVRDQATDVPDEEGLALSGSSDTSVASFLEDLSSEEGMSKASARLAVASRDVKRAVRLAKQFRAAARTIDSLECSNESENQMRSLYTKELMDKAVFYAKKANEALAGYAALRRALQEVADTSGGEELWRLDALQDAQRRSPYDPSLESTYFQGEQPPYGPPPYGCGSAAPGQGYGFDGPRGAPGFLDAQRLRWASAPVVGHPPSVQTALNLSRMADMVMSKAQQASEEALKFQRFSEEALAGAKVVEGVSDARLPPFELKDTRKAPDRRPVSAVGFDHTATECAIGKGPSTPKGITKMRMSETTAAESNRQLGQLGEHGLPQPRGFNNDQTMRKSNAEKRSAHKDGSSDLEADLVDRGQRATGQSAMHSTKQRATRRASVSAAGASHIHNREAIEQSHGKPARASVRRASISLQQEPFDTNEPPPPRRTKSLAARRASVGAGLLLKLGAHMKDSSESSSPEKEPPVPAAAADSASFKATATRKASVSSRLPSAKPDNEDVDAFRSKAARRASVLTKALSTSLDRTTTDSDSFKARTSRRASVSSKAVLPPDESMRNEQDQPRFKALRRASVSRDFPADLSYEYETFKVKTARQASVSNASDDGSFKAKAARKSSVSHRLVSPNLHSPTEGQKPFKAKAARRASVSAKFPAGHTELPGPFKAERRASVSRVTPEGPPDMSEPFKAKPHRKSTGSTMSPEGRKEMYESFEAEAVRGSGFPAMSPDDEQEMSAPFEVKASRKGKGSVKSPEDRYEDSEPFKAKAARRASVSAKVAEGSPDTQHESFKAKVARRASVSAKGLAREEGAEKHREECRGAGVFSAVQSSQPDSPTHETHAHKANGAKVTVAEPDIREASNRPPKKPPRRASVCAAKYKRLHGDVSAEQATKSDGVDNKGSKLLDEPTLVDKQARRSSISAAKDSRGVLKEELKKPESGSVHASAIAASGPSVSTGQGKSALNEGTEYNKQPPAAVAQESTLLHQLLEPSTAWTGAKTTKDTKGGRIVVKIKPPPVHISSKKVGTHRATKDKGLIAAIRDECVHDNCGSYPAGPREIQQIIDEGVGKPKYTRDMKSGQMISPRISEIIYELSEQSLDIDVVPSERCKGTQSSLPFGGVPCKEYHRNQVIASTNDSANKEAARSKMLDTLREDAKDKQARNEGMPKHSKHMRESRSLEGGKVAEKAPDSTEVRSSRRLSSTVQGTTNEDAESTSRLHNIKASQKKRTHPDSHKSGSDAQLKVLPSDTYVFMAATAANAGGDAKNPKAATATGKGSKKMGKKADSSENPRKSSKHSNESSKSESRADKSSRHSEGSLKQKHGAQKSSGHSKESLKQEHGAEKPSGHSKESLKGKHGAEKRSRPSNESLKQKHGAEKPSEPSNESLKLKPGAKESSGHSKESLKERHHAEKPSGVSNESLKQKHGAEKPSGPPNESLKLKHDAKMSSGHSKESLTQKHGAEKSSGHSKESLKQKHGAEKPSRHSHDSLKQTHGTEKPARPSHETLKQKHNDEKSSRHSKEILKQKHGAEKPPGHSKESLKHESSATDKRSSSLKPAKGSSESANESSKREKTPPVRHEKEAKERDEQHSDQESAGKTEKRTDTKAEEGKRNKSKDRKAADLKNKEHKASVKKDGEDSDLKNAKSSDEDVKTRKGSSKKGDEPKEDSDELKDSGSKREDRERSGTHKACEVIDDSGRETKGSEDETVQRPTTHGDRSKNGDESGEKRRRTGYLEDADKKSDVKKQPTKVNEGNFSADKEKGVPFTVEVDSKSGLPWNTLNANQNFEMTATVRNDANYAYSRSKQVIASPDYIPEDKHKRTETSTVGADGLYNQQLAFAVGKNTVGSSSSSMVMTSSALDDAIHVDQEPPELVVPKKLAFGADNWAIVSPLETSSDRSEPPNVLRPGRSEDLTASESAQVDARSESLYNVSQTLELHDDITEEDIHEPERTASWSRQEEQPEEEPSERYQQEELPDDELPELELPEEEPPEEGSPREDIPEQEYLEEEAPVDEHAIAVEVPEPEHNEEVQQALSDRQDPGMQEVIELQNVDYELQSRPHAPLRGPDLRDFNFWDLDGPAVLYPESRLVFALAFVAAMWILYLLFTTRATWNSRPHFELFTMLATVHEIPRDRIMVQPFAVKDLKTKGTAATEMESIVSVRPRFLYICDTRYCRESALRFTRTLGEDPCSNFYSYACGKLTRKWNPMVGSALSTDAFIVDEAAKLGSNFILNQEHPGMKAARNLLEACLNHEHDEQWGRTELSELFFEYFGSSWPAENNSVTVEAVWVIAGRLARDLKVEVLARVSIGVHLQDNSSIVPTVDEPVLLYRRADFEAPGYSEMLKTAIEQAVTFISPATNGAPYVSGIKTTMELLADMVSTDSAGSACTKGHRLAKVRDLPTGVRTFLRTVFLDSVRVDENVDILVKSMRFFENLQEPRSSLLDPQALFNYVGFRVMVYFAAFLPQPNLRRLRALEVNYLLPENASAQDFCTREVERVFPVIYARAFALQKTNLTNWLSAWSSELNRIVTQIRAPEPAPVSAHDTQVPRHRLDSLKVEAAVPQWILNDSSFGPYAQGLERQLSVALNLDPSNSLKRLCFFAKMLRQHEIEQALRGASENRSVASLFGTDAKYDAPSHTIYVPMITVNWSLPADSVTFVVHAARYAVRVFKALAPMLRQDYARSSEQPNSSEVYSEGYHERLNDTTRCLVEQYENASRNLKSAYLNKMTDRTQLGHALLDQTTALVQAYSVFKENLRARRFVNSNFRLAGLPHLTPEQLFFVAYGQDNCEVSDTVRRRRRWHEHGELPPEDRVNIPLMQFEEFARVFDCNDTASMAANRRCPMAHIATTY